MTVIDFHVPAIPVAQPRQRHRVVTFNGHMVASNYTPTKHPVTAYKATVRQSFSDAYQGPPLDGPLFARFIFVLPRPASMRWKTRPTPRVPHTSSKDLDNLFKSTADALNGLAWVDDGRIYSASVSKWIASGDEQPHVEIRIEAGGER